MHLKKKLILFVAMAFLPMAFSFAQSQMDRLVENIEAYHQTYPFEKVYLHTDKPHYFLNDTIWIKAYGLMDVGQENPIRTNSVPLYVELLQNGLLPYVSRIIIKLEDGLGQGDIVLPRNLKPGVYTLRAYTEWMRNFGQEAFFVIFNKETEELNYRKPLMNQKNLTRRGNLIYSTHANPLPVQITKLTLTGKALRLFEDGSYFHTFDLYLDGYMAWEKIGDLIPFDYKDPSSQ